MGTLMRNTACQENAEVRKPPRTGPAIMAIPEDAPMTDMPSPLRSTGSMCTIMDGRAELIMAAAIPCMSLNATSIQKFVDRAHIRDDTPKMMVPQIMNLLTRLFFAIFPKGRSRAASPST